jgi:hypothetical protein
VNSPDSGTRSVKARSAGSWPRPGWALRPAEPVGAEYCVTSRDLGVFVEEATESVLSDDLDVGVDGIG